MAVSVTIIVLVCVFLGIYLIKNKKEPEQKKVTVETKTTKVSARRQAIEARGKRLERHDKIRTVLIYINSLNRLLNETHNFYDYERNSTQYVIDRSGMMTEDIDDDIIGIAFRVCDRHYGKGDCSHHLSDSDKKNILGWSDYHVDKDSLLNDVLISFKEYWNDVLNSYVRESARQKRYISLIEYIDSILEKNYIIENESVFNGLLAYRQELTDKSK